jgi:NAD-dependent dihydropyrimidine dehydrogenase PreA subunit
MLPVVPDDSQEIGALRMHKDLKLWRKTKSDVGIYGTSVAVDFDLCVVDIACIDVSPVNVIDWFGAGDNRKVMPTKERDCIFCFGCEGACPKCTIRVTRQPS